MEPAALVPHRPPMLLIGTVLEAGPERCATRTRVDPAAWYADPDGAMPGWFGLELMAQTAAAHAGGRRRGGPPGFGYLLGTRRYTCQAPAFPAGAVLEVEARAVDPDGSGLAAYDCELRQDGAVLARAILKVFEP
jgi:predicted hotdog family 3-hydroxylacyl-ACP dehydratase